MAHQSLDHSEILNVRWATADPNPLAQKREVRRIEEQAAEAVRRALPEEFVAEIEGKDGEARKRKRVEGGFGLAGYEAPDDVYFARGANAVNPVGRRGMELETEERLMIEDYQLQQYEAEESGIFSNSTLAALQSTQSSVVTNPKPAAPSGPLVDYDSDSD